MYAGIHWLSHLLAMKLQATVSCHVSTGSWTWVLCKHSSVFNYSVISLASLSSYLETMKESKKPIRPSYTIEESRPWRWKTKLWIISLCCRINDPGFSGVLSPCVEWEVLSRTLRQSCQTSFEPWILLNKIEDQVLLSSWRQAGLALLRKRDWTNTIRNRRFFLRHSYVLSAMPRNRFSLHCSLLVGLAERNCRFPLHPSYAPGSTCCQFCHSLKTLAC